MGRLRDGFETPLFRSISEEVIDLFGNEDGILHRFDALESEKTRDPLWDEPSHKPAYKKFNLPYIIQEFVSPIDVGESGHENMFQANISISREHILKAGMAVLDDGEYIASGDIFECYTNGLRTFYSIIERQRTGFVNDTDSWTMYNLTCKRTNKFVPERLL
jgi:hypothetical protein